MTPEETLRAYEQGPSDVEGMIRDQITNAYGNLEPQIRDVRHYETSQLPTFYNQFVGGYGMGTGAADLSPAQRMAMAGEAVGRQATLGRTARDILDVRRASLEDLVGKAQANYDRGYQGAQNAYNRWWQEQQAAEDKRRFEQQMALQRASLGGRGSTVDTTAIDALIKSLGTGGVDMNALNAELRGIGRIGSSNSTTARQRFMNLNNVLQNYGGYQQNMDLGSLLYNAGFSNDWINRNAEKGWDWLYNWANPTA